MNETTKTDACGGERRDVLEKLRAMLATHPAGCPPAEEIIEILEILFTHEEAQAAIGLGFVPFDLKTVSERSGVTEDDAKQRLESLADKGLVFIRLKNGKEEYSLLPVMPGVFEFPFMKGKRTETLDRLAALWKVYLAKLTTEFGSPGMAFSRIIPIGKTVESVPGTLTYEKVEEMIDKANAVGLAHCACRETEGNCDAPREACMLFDETCDFLVERGFARYLTKEEMKSKLIEFDDLGLIHQVNNTQNKITFICNCCACCCGLLRSKLVYGNQYVFNPSGFVAECDLEYCSQCGKCADERCHLNAITMTDNGPVISAEQCIGCGLCVTGCPTDAMKLVRREIIKKTAKNNRDMGVTILMEKGRLQDFMPYADPAARPHKT
ncbi:MAG: 4Fe-4S binding protein [bacterium]